jgi:hypothetical protein
VKFSWPTIATLLVTSFLAPLLAGAGLDLTTAQAAWLTGALIGAPTFIAHALHTLFAKRAASPVIGTRVGAMFLAALIVPFALTLTGCKTLMQPGTVQYVSEQAGVEAASGLLIQYGSPDPTVWRARAALLKGAATETEALVTGDSVTLLQIETALKAVVIKSDPGPANVLAIDTFIDGFGAALQQMAVAGTGPLTDVQKANAKQALDWVIASANAYTVQAARLSARLAARRQ